jgi:ferredoxin-NADP reductase
MKAQLISKQEIAEKIWQFDFDLLEEQIDFEPGQYIIIKLLRPAYEDDRGSSRYFSLINFPKRNHIISFATREGVSAFKKSLWEMEYGMEVEMSQASGGFVLPSDKKDLVMIAGGIGITPLISMMRFIEKEITGHRVEFIYSNRDQKSAAFLEELRQFVASDENFKLIFSATEDPSWQGESGRIDKEFLIKHITDQENKIFLISGPPAMVEGVRRNLLEWGISEDAVRTENLAGY